jgi:hypothetical protein
MKASFIVVALRCTGQSRTGVVASMSVRVVFPRVHVVTVTAHLGSRSAGTCHLRIPRSGYGLVLVLDVSIIISAARSRRSACPPIRALIHERRRE